MESDHSISLVLLKFSQIYQEFKVQIVSSGKEGVVATETDRFDAILLADELSDGDGLEICHRIRRHDYRTPIIILSEQAGDAHLVLCLERGANARIKKPLKTNVLRAQLCALFRQSQNAHDSSTKLAHYDFYPAQKLMKNRHTNRKIDLTEKETAIVRLLLDAGGNWVGRDEIYREIWGYSIAVRTHTLETNIYRLRQKLEPDPSNPTIVLSARGGYRLNLDEEQDTVSEA